MIVHKGSMVWVQDRDLAWVAAEVLDSSSNRFIHLLTVSGKKVVSPPEKLLPRDADEDEHGEVEDMTRLAYLNEPGVLYNLRRRYALNDIYVSPSPSPPPPVATAASSFKNSLTLPTSTSSSLPIIPLFSLLSHHFGPHDLLPKGVPLLLEPRHNNLSLIPHTHHDFSLPNEVNVNGYSTNPNSNLKVEPLEGASPNGVNGYATNPDAMLKVESLEAAKSFPWDEFEKGDDAVEKGDDEVDEREEDEGEGVAWRKGKII